MVQDAVFEELFHVITELFFPIFSEVGFVGLY